MEEKSDSSSIVISLEMNSRSVVDVLNFLVKNFNFFFHLESEVFGMSDAPCSEVQAIVALSLLKNEKDVTVMTFTDEKNKLKPVAWTAETSFDKAMEIYEKEIVSWKLYKLCKNSKSTKIIFNS